jgi:hypothetical protein
MASKREGSGDTTTEVVLRRRGDLTVTLPLAALHSTVGVAPASFEATSSRSPPPTAATWTPFLVRQCLATLTGGTKRSCATWTRALARSPLPVLCS